MKRHLLLDMDGVIVDFLAGAMEMLNVAYDKKYKPSEYVDLHGKFGINELYGVSEKEFWEVLAYDDRFWEHLKPTSYGLKLYFWLARIAPITILTAPNLDPDCPRQKLVWLKKHLCLDINFVMMGSRKYLLAGNGILIDDNSKNCDDFIAAGGEAILVPSEWNTKGVNFKMVVGVIQQNKYIQEWMKR